MPWGTIAVKFTIGGVFVALFALAGEVFASKRLSSVFGGAPSVATATLLIYRAHSGGQNHSTR
jgi:hypothetical protein